MKIIPSDIRMLLRGVFGVASGLFALCWLLRPERRFRGLDGVYSVVGAALALCGALCLVLFFLHKK